MGAKTDNTKFRRRITPTPVQATNNFPSKFGKSHFSAPPEKIQSEVFRSPAFQDSSDLQQERELLKATRHSLSKPTALPENKPNANGSDLKPGQMKSCDQFLFPDPQQISMIQEVSDLSKIYSFLLQNALVPNITSELYFLFELMTARIAGEDRPQKKDIFCSIHNCVYFAVSVLGGQFSVLQILDKATLASLKEIPYLIKFSPQLVYFLNLCSLAKQEATPLMPSLTAVPFRVEEDSRVNFPDEYSFVCFKKQRDLFYEMLREWQHSTECVDDKFQGTFLRKARQLINLGPNPINMFHLARLFQSQLIASCTCLEVNEVYDELLNDIQKNFPDKFKKLQERFLTPSCIGGLTPPPSFYGIQSFFSELIVCAGSPSLNQHLVNMFVSRILELNDTDVFSVEELSSLGTAKNKYIFLLHTLRLLGKFLGFVHFLPYAKEESTPPYIAKQQLTSRQHTPPILNLPELLMNGMKNGHIVLTVPWIVEYLSMVDSLGKQLKYVEEALKLLMLIYRCNVFPSQNVHSHLFLQVIIGWLFEVLRYPKSYPGTLQLSCVQSISLGAGLDSLSVIDKQLIHSCCPYLIEFKVLVYNFLNGIRDKKEVRKITPLSTVNSSRLKSSATSMHQLEHRLEENFFFLHPSSMKKTADFISERMASKVISIIRFDVTSVKLKVVEDINNNEYFNSEGCKDDSKSREAYIDELLDTKTTVAYKDILDKSTVSIEKIHSEINSIIPMMLSEDTKPVISEMCCKISFRMAVDKIIDWCNANLLLDAIKTDIRNKVQYSSKSEKTVESDKHLDASHWIGVFRSAVIKLHSQSVEFDFKYISSLCSKMTELIAEESSVAITKTIMLLSVDLCIALIVHSPKTCCEELNECFVRFWVNCPKNMVLRKVVLSPQNLKLLMTSKDTLSQKKFELLVKSFIDKNVFSVEELNVSIKEVEEIQNQDIKYTDIIDNVFQDLLLTSA